MKNKLVISFIVLVFLSTIAAAKKLPYEDIEHIGLAYATRFDIKSSNIEGSSWVNKFDINDLVVTFGILEIKWKNSDRVDEHYFLKLDDGKNVQKFLANSGSYEYYNDDSIKSMLIEYRPLDEETADISNKVYAYLIYSESGTIKESSLFFFNQQEDKDVYNTKRDIKEVKITENFASNKNIIKEVGDVKKEEITKCIDSDGEDYYKKGTVKYPCVDGPCWMIDGCHENLLEERTCKNDLEPETVFYTCPDGCEDGACVGEPAEEEKEG